MKKLLLLLLLPVILLAGCGKVPQSDDFTSEENNRFIFVKRYDVSNDDYFKILVDKETKVMYLYKVSSGGSTYATAGLTVMLNPDGTPMLWQGEL